MSMIYGKCLNCLNYIGGRMCFAYPDGIPDEQFSGGKKHDKKIEGQYGDYTYQPPSDK